VASWEDAQYSFSLVRSSYNDVLGLVAFSKLANAQAELAYAVDELGVNTVKCPIHGLWFAKTLADFEINDIAALPPLFCYNS
jgi:hypothetical protein